MNRILIILLICVGCNHTKEVIMTENIHIERYRQHPFLADHSKRLVIRNNNGKLLDSKELYSDAGGGSSAFLFEEKDRFILIDCNGAWFSIAKTNGKIGKMGWFWKKELPGHYLGTFERNFSSKDYLLHRRKQIGIENVYLFKDPADPGENRSNTKRLLKYRNIF